MHPSSPLTTLDSHGFYLEGSSNKGVLLVHGLTGSPSEMKFVGKHLHKRGFSVYAPTLAGHCSDEAALLATTYEDWLKSLDDALFEFKSRVPHISAAGICVGGALALYLASQRPTIIEQVAIYGPALNYDGWNQPKWSRSSRIFKDLLIHIPKIRDARFEERYPFGIKSDRVRQLIMRDPQGIEGTLPHFPAQALYQNYRLNDALKKALPSITTPTLLVHAREDDISHPRNSYAIQKRHGGHCEVHLLDDSYHMIHVDQQRHEVADLTATFFGAAAMPTRMGGLPREASHG